MKKFLIFALFGCMDVQAAEMAAVYARIAEQYMVRPETPPNRMDLVEQDDANSGANLAGRFYALKQDYRNADRDGKAEVKKQIVKLNTIAQRKGNQKLVREISAFLNKNGR